MTRGRILVDHLARGVTLQADGKLQLDNGNPLLDDPRWLAPVTGTVYGVALNHRSLVEALSAAFEDAPYKTAPKTPVLFIKTRNTQIGHGAAIPFPAGVARIQPGGALGVVIGKRARKVSEAQALDCIEGYTVVNEVSLPEDSFYRPAIKAKNRDGFCPIGPRVVDAKQIDPAALEIRTYVNDELRETSRTSDLVRGVAQLIAELSQFMTLEAGDLIIAGTPLRSVDLQPGDVVAVEIDGIGRLENPVVLETVIAEELA
ncbi:fumarylacetoacetate hydrolase family protein [Pseudogulbenkiania ferrooxidans]|uniref:4-hydroxyphenylacetate degradation bifunctional isomerase/decarboxylase, HpaG1 subunit n=1 Tax=Pseudogulbenkiania ferrooxidans 2002 TaxID=279714 RepID=B9Z404_9NEIS|nr:fumarylacetoacetate hydrolase family protein [Pseudogulbenkiania ferrooxidans]EEG08581.1 4-hydroxyphenylacetate degradation bifunctional isomerase/decarboxylase, HpaG1 subunit [Pseudogulbenkiania ferrooxidans 2002]